jgi:pimeloyl-ACP methyl ester carboxylesterase
MAIYSANKSTTVRTINFAFRVLEHLAPQVGARWADRIWFTLPAVAPGAAAQSSQQPEAGRADSPSIRELLGSDFEVTLRGRTVRGWSWGDGPVVYLVHGWAGSAEQLTLLVAPLLDAGFQVVAFDGLSHGRSDAGVDGPMSTHAVELGRSLDAVAARFGPARGIVAHSLGSLVTVLALRDGWVATERLVLIAPVEGVPEFMQRIRGWLGFGPRIERRLAELAKQRTGYAVDELDVARLGDDLERDGSSRPQLLVIHDLNDRETAHAASATLVRRWPEAQLVSTTGLGHVRILGDKAVGGMVARFISREPVEPLLHAGDTPQPLRLDRHAEPAHVA